MLRGNTNHMQSLRNSCADLRFTPLLFYGSNWGHKIADFVGFKIYFFFFFFFFFLLLSPLLLLLKLLNVL